MKLQTCTQTNNPSKQINPTFQDLCPQCNEIWYIFILVAKPWKVKSNMVESKLKYQVTKIKSFSIQSDFKLGS